MPLTAPPEAEVVPAADVAAARPRRARFSAVRPYYESFRSFLFDPLQVANKIRALPHFLTNWYRYARRNRDGRFPIRLGELMFTSADRFRGAGTARGHYFFQDLWAATYLFQHETREHVDVASRVDGFVAHVLPFCRVTYVDIRPLESQIENLVFRAGSLSGLPFADGSVRSMSCLHVLEHVGLGRYGDPVDPQGYLAASAELARVLAPGGVLLVGTPVGRERLCFDAHRVFDPATVETAFVGLTLEEFHLIDDVGDAVLRNASYELARACSYGCGLFVFRKPPSMSAHSGGPPP